MIFVDLQNILLIAFCFFSFAYGWAIGLDNF